MCGFVDDDVVYVDGVVNLVFDMEMINVEFMFVDLEIVDKVIVWYEKEVCGKKIEFIVFEIVKVVKDVLECGVFFLVVGIDLMLICEFGLLIVKLVIFVFNVDEVVFIDDVCKVELVVFVVFVKVIFFDVKIELEFIDFDLEDVVELFVFIG